MAPLPWDPKKRIFPGLSKNTRNLCVKNYATGLYFSVKNTQLSKIFGRFFQNCDPI